MAFKMVGRMLFEYLLMSVTSGVRPPPHLQMHQAHSLTKNSWCPNTWSVIFSDLHNDGENVVWVFSDVCDLWCPTTPSPPDAPSPQPHKKFLVSQHLVYHLLWPLKGGENVV